MDEISSESKSIIDFDDEYSENEKQNDTPIENNISQNEKVNPNENEPIEQSPNNYQDTQKEENANISKQ